MAKRPKITLEETRLAAMLDNHLERLMSGEGDGTRFADPDTERELASLLEVADLLRLRGEALRRMA